MAGRLFLGDLDTRTRGSSTPAAPAYPMGPLGPPPTRRAPSPVPMNLGQVARTGSGGYQFPSLGSILGNGAQTPGIPQLQSPAMNAPAQPSMDSYSWLGPLLQRLGQFL